MGWFSKRQESADRRAFRELFEKGMKDVRESELATQIAVGTGVNMAHNFFLKRFGTVESFVQLANDDRLAYLDSITRMEERMSGRGDRATSFGFGLFKMWLAALSAGDQELANQFLKELAPCADKGIPFSP